MADEEQPEKDTKSRISSPLRIAPPNSHRTFPQRKQRKEDSLQDKFHIKSNRQG